MFTEERNADVVKKVRINDNEDVFIALIEHKSAVDYNVSMQILRYMVYIWEDYERRQEKRIPGVSKCFLVTKIKSTLTFAVPIFKM